MACEGCTDSISLSVIEAFFGSRLADPWLASGSNEDLGRLPRFRLDLAGSFRESRVAIGCIDSVSSDFRLFSLEFWSWLYSESSSSSGI